MPALKPTQLVTHARPHLDDVAGLWLLKRFHPEFGSLPVEFLARPLNGRYQIPDSALAIGIGGGRFDEHKGDLNDCATTLVWKWLKDQPEVTLDPTTSQALDRLVSWVLKDDLGQLNSVPWRDWSVSAVFGNYDEVAGDNDQQVYRFGSELLESLLVGFGNQVLLDEVWRNRIEFDTPWGKGIGLVSSIYGSSARSYGQGAVLICEINPEKGYRQIRADAHSNVDLANAYEKVRQLEPEASWFLHHSKRLLLCGSDSAPSFHSSRLTLDQLIDLVKAHN